MKIIKKGLAVLLCMIIMLGAASIAANAGTISMPYIWGDINVNRKVDLSDIVALREHIMNLDYYYETAHMRCDLNFDGYVNLADIVILRRIIFTEHAAPRIPLVDDGTITQIKQDWVAKYTEVNIDEIWIEPYGSYNDAVAVVLSDSYHMSTDNIWQDKIDGVAFTYFSGDEIKVWKNGDFYTLRTAYESGLITKGDLLTIAYARRVSQLTYYS